MAKSKAPEKVPEKEPEPAPEAPKPPATDLPTGARSRR